MRALAAYGLLLALLVAVVPTARARNEMSPDPARVAGTWQYRTRSNCGRVEGVGQISFTWDEARGVYRERGHVYWADSGLTVRWWGDKRFDRESRRLTGRVENSLGDTVDGYWQLEGDGPDRLVVEWRQTNGCYGRGVATRSAAPR